VPLRPALGNAAKAATEAGFPDCYNILEGFEGNKDANGQRNRSGGWRHAACPGTKAEVQPCKPRPSPSTASTASPTRTPASASAPPSAKLGDKVVLLCHHYQRADVYAHADITGDSLKLSRLASQSERREHRLLRRAFHGRGGRHPVAPEQVSILPDLAAGCSMADMASLAKVERAWRELAAVLEPRREGDAGHLHQFRRRPQGLLRRTRRHRLHLVQRAEDPRLGLRPREKVLFFPDQHLGRWSGFKMGIPLDEMVIWNPDLEQGGLTREQIEKAKIILWHGYCSVHQMFQPRDIIKFRNQYPDGLVISHPECSFEVCKQSDYIGSTETILQTVKAARRTRAGWSAPNSTWSSAWPRK
jgi:quinolinate synthase